MKKAYYSVMLMVIVIAFPVMINKGFAQTTTMFVDPANVQDIPVGNTFDITLKVADVQGLYAWQAKILFKPGLLNCTSATIPVDNIFAGKTIVEVTPVIDNAGGSVLYGVTMMGAGPGVTGSGKLCQIRFMVLGLGNSSLSYSLPYGSKTYLLDYDLNVMSSLLQNGYFTNVSPPPQETHDVAVTGLSVSDDHPKQGQNVTMTVGVKNNGTLPETFSVQVTNDTIVIGMQTVTALASGASTTLTFVWNTSAATIGAHTITANATGVPSDANPANNAASTTVTVVSPRDVAVTGLSVSDDHPKQGQNVTMTVGVKNNGTLPETFSVQVTNDTIVIGMQTVTALASGASTTLTFVWNTSAATIGAHTITANATGVPSDANPANNAASTTVTVKSPSPTGSSTDLNGDLKVDIRDVAVVGVAFGTQEGDSRWNPAADVNGDTIVNITDAALVCKDFGKIL
jgi:hypothetical protein